MYSFKIEKCLTQIMKNHNKKFKKEGYFSLIKKQNYVMH